jgi:hypothetical protein
MLMNYVNNNFKVSSEDLFDNEEEHREAIKLFNTCMRFFAAIVKQLGNLEKNILTFSTK